MSQKQKKSRGPGRPQSGGPTPRRSIRISDAELAIFQEAAKKAGKSFSEWALDLMRKAAGK